MPFRLSSMNLFPRSIAARLSILLFFVLFVFASLQYLILSSLWIRGTREHGQRMHWEVADEFAREVRDLLKPAIAEGELKRSLARLIRLNPMVDIGIVNQRGEVLFAAISTFNAVIGFRPGEYTINLAPVKEFLALDPKRRLPIYGDPLGTTSGMPPRKRVFSAAPITIAGSPGYLYVVLDSSKIALLNESLETRYLMHGGMLTIGGLFFVALSCASFFFYLLTRRLRTMTRQVTKIAAGEHSVRIDPHGTDEVAELGTNVNLMVETIVDSLRQAAEANNYRINLVTALSHDIGTPLAAILAHNEILARSVSTNKSALEASETIHRNAGSASRMIRDLLDLTKIELGALKPEIREVNFSELVTEEIVPQLSPLAQVFEVALSVQMDSREYFVSADSGMIERVLANLIENGIRYNRTGGSVVVSAEVQGENLRIAVSNTGFGLSDEERELIFRPFYRSQAAKTKVSGGSGLGLWIVRSLLAAHGQSIEVSSELGGSTIFSFTLPIAEV